MPEIIKPREFRLRNHIGQYNESSLAYLGGLDHKKTGAHKSVGGASLRTLHEMLMAANMGADAIRALGLPYETEISNIGITAEPYPGFDPAELQGKLPDNMPMHLFTMPAAQNGVLTYDDIYVALINDQEFMNRRRQEYKDPNVDSHFGQWHFFVTDAVERQVIQSLESNANIFPLTRFHSDLGLNIAADYGMDFLWQIGFTPSRLAHEIQALRGYSVFSLEHQRQAMIANYTRVPYDEEHGLAFTTDELDARSLTVPLSYDRKLFQADDGTRRHDQREKYLAKYGVTDNDYVIDIFTRMDPEKGYHRWRAMAQEYLIDRYNRTKSDTGLPYFVFYGGVPEKSAKMMEVWNEVIAAHHDFIGNFPDELTRHIIFYGAPAFYEDGYRDQNIVKSIRHEEGNHMADVRAQTAFTETFNMNGAETAASGIPQIASNIPTHQSVLADGAILVDMDHPDAVFAAIDELHDPETRHEIGVAGIAHAQQFTHEASIKALVEQGKQKIPGLFP